MSLNELLEEIFDTDVISLEDYMNRINEVENFFLNNGNSEWKTYYRGDKFCSKTQSNFFRFGDIKELNGAVQFLCSEAASFVTGAMLPIDGGFSAFSGV